MANGPFYELVAEEWRKRGVGILPPEVDSEVARVFATLGSPLSADVLGLYSIVGGFVNGEMDGLWSFWSLPRILKEHTGRPRPFVMFADWLIRSHIYCLHYETPEVSSVYVSHDGRFLEPGPLAASVGEFLEKLLCEPDEMMAWPLKS